MVKQGQILMLIELILLKDEYNEILMDNNELLELIYKIKIKKCFEN